MPLSVNIPFAGFYDSLWSHMLDDQANQFCEYEAEYREEENGIPPELRLDANEFAEILNDVTNYKAQQEHLARHYVDAFNEWAKDQIGFDPKLSFEEMTSPRYYNFETDRIFCTISQKVARGLFAISKKEKHERLAAAIKERHTSYDGFISFYSNDLASWLEKPVTEWDANELGTLLRAICGELDPWKLYDDIPDSGYHSFEAGVNWQAFETKVAEARELKVEEFRKDNPEYVPAYRWGETIDLFTGKAG